ncbi:restriction endonuclease subunit S [Elizabethkingia anophelis]|uniref:restriction endonuclease subunit S n=1 Tax=Elizabethkingia anophelis TaxID=1117645 RepID=UPI00077E7B9C|nr:restriction endonuclease subunit S [Elizabethkingia anophelis]AMR39839.1 hypothetical protein A2T74_00020 [Elizabethkingia anophelis]AMX46477.1 hypothetical protein A4C56_00020 [Elizabethkingia anophelis]AMX49936.1 hypothetical protein A2T72_00020 [Elizabethkingia anophelis]AMX53327.1 hypothetical protein A2T59_00020 [Elizabethkingia anophelis]EGT4347328.1 restriction endonuclease subunit S [Elizabethkingia anophelis]
MENVQKTFLNFLNFTDLENWSSYSLLGKNLNYTQKYPFAKISAFLKRNKTPIDVVDGQLYKRATIKINGQGIFLRDIKDGKEIGTKKQFLISKGQFLLSKIDARNGAFGVVPEELDDAIITGNFWTFDVDYSLVNPFYLTLLTGTKEFQKLSQTASVGTTNRNYLQEIDFLNFKVPLPSLQEQQAIVDEYFAKIKEANQLAAEANNIDQEIEKYLFSELGISIGNKNVKNKGLNLVEFSQLERWGVEYNLNSSKSLLSSKRFPNKRLKDIILINPTTTLPKEANLPISFIPMEVVSDDYGIVTELRNKTISESKGYTKFMEGDLIWARITPCMQNGKSAIVKNLENGLGVGSTEFHVLRNNNPKINLDYIYHFLRLDIVLKDAMSHFTGSAGQQRVPKSYLEELLIPIPEYQKQTEISNHLYQLKDLKIKLFNKVEELKHQANEAFEKAIFQ